MNLFIQKIIFLQWAPIKGINRSGMRNVAQDHAHLPCSALWAVWWKWPTGGLACSVSCLWQERSCSVSLAPSVVRVAVVGGANVLVCLYGALLTSCLPSSFHKVAEVWICGPFQGTGLFGNQNIIPLVLPVQANLTEFHQKLYRRRWSEIEKGVQHFRKSCLRL